LRITICIVFDLTSFQELNLLKAKDLKSIATMAAKSKINELQQKLNELQEKYRGKQKVNSELLMKIQQLTDSNMNYYGQDECNKLSKVSASARCSSIL
jgi:heat shock protein HslJ